MINPGQFISEVLEPALKALDMFSEDAMHLMLRTAIIESQLTHILQIPNGPALGFMQVEYATYLDVVRYLNQRSDIKERVLRYTEYMTLPTKPVSVISNISLNVIAARIKYWMQPEAIPAYKDVEAQAEYYLQYYNTAKGSSNLHKFKMASQVSYSWYPKSDNP